MSDITVIILTKNEEKNIKASIISSKQIAERIIVVDSGSNDKTIEIAKELGAEVYYHEWEGHAKQFNWALDNCSVKTEWVFRLDADERISKELACEINQKLKSTSIKNVDGYEMRWRIYFMGKWIRHGGTHKPYFLRLFRYGKGRVENKLMDEHIIVNGKVEKLDGDLIHYDYKGLDAWLNKHIWYSQLELQMYETQREDTGVIKCARVHGVLPFLQECPVFMEEPYREKLFFYLKDYAYKDAQQAYAAETLFELFEKNGIYCMPLKGIRTKQFYPYPEFRTMGDLDILYKEDQTKKLKQVMQDAGYKFGGYNIKHDEYEKDGVTIEMHRDVLFRLTNAYDYFADIWERAIHAKGKQYIYEMSLEDHYLHSVCHLAEHFVRGGIGIRMVLDIYILSETPRMDKAYVQRQLKALKLQKFEENIRSLAQLWFSDDEKTVRTEVSDELENYALSGGIFGSRETARRNGTVLYESKNKFVKQLVFPSYEVMKTSCPWLKTPILLPAAWLVRYKRALTASRTDSDH